MWKLIPIFLILTSCAVAPVPNDLTAQDCIQHGIEVPEGAIQTGIIVKQTQPRHIMGGFAAVERECVESYGWLVSGCTKAVDSKVFPAPDHRYEIVYTDGYGAIHEACHALYETSNHTVTYFIAEVTNTRRDAPPEMSRGEASR